MPSFSISTEALFSLSCLARIERSNVNTLVSGPVPLLHLSLLFIDEGHLVPVFSLWLNFLIVVVYGLIFRSSYGNSAIVSFLI